MPNDPSSSLLPFSFCGQSGLFLLGYGRKSGHLRAECEDVLILLGGERLELTQHLMSERENVDERMKESEKNRMRDRKRRQTSCKWADFFLNAASTRSKLSISLQKEI